MIDGFPNSFDNQQDQQIDSNHEKNSSSLKIKMIRESEANGASEI